jgi:peptidyl-prolyl cis-trans isomerase C
MVRRAALVAAVLSAVSCAGEKGAPAKKGPFVAKGEGIAITADDLKARIDEQSPMVRQSFQSLERKKQFLDNLVRFELLARAAEKSGLANDPDVKLTMKKVLVSKYYQRFFANAKGAEIPDAEVQKYYDEHPAEFHRPERIHAQHVFLKAAAGSPERAQKLAEAKKLLAKILADTKKNPGAFSAVARQSSDDQATKGLGGDLGFRTQEELEKVQGKEVAETLSRLKDGEISPAVLETPQGFHLLRVVGRQPEQHRTLEQAKAMIASRLRSQRKTKEFDDMVKKLRDDAHVVIDDSALEKVAVAGGPAGPMGMMPHGPMGPAPRPAAPAPAAPRPAEKPAQNAPTAAH